ncbi:hypothetical protein [Pseudonocardia alni]|nr:hypothetical protein [Pseudonocardia alni]
MVCTDIVRRDLQPVVDTASKPDADLTAVIAVLARYHRDLLNR